MSGETVELPIKGYARQIVEIVKLNAITIVIGETGSGKTTQIPQVGVLLGTRDLFLIIKTNYPEFLVHSSSAKLLHNWTTTYLGAMKQIADCSPKKDYSSWTN
jgi:hypothetical protein